MRWREVKSAETALERARTQTNSSTNLQCMPNVEPFTVEMIAMQSSPPGQPSKEHSLQNYETSPPTHLVACTRQQRRRWAAARSRRADPNQQTAGFPNLQPEGKRMSCNASLRVDGGDGGRVKEGGAARGLVSFVTLVTLPLAPSTAQTAK